MLCKVLTHVGYMTGHVGCHVVCHVVWPLLCRSDNFYMHASLTWLGRAVRNSTGAVLRLPIGNSKVCLHTTRGVTCASLEVLLLICLRQEDQWTALVLMLKMH